MTFVRVYPVLRVSFIIVTTFLNVRQGSGLISLSVTAFNWSHSLVYIIFSNVSCMSFSNMTLDCAVLSLQYIYSLYLKVLEMLLLSKQHVHINGPHVGLIISKGLKMLCHIRCSDIFKMHLALVNIVSGCWLLFMCYVSSLCSFVLCSVW